MMPGAGLGAVPVAMTELPRIASSSEPTAHEWVFECHRRSRMMGEPVVSLVRISGRNPGAGLASRCIRQRNGTMSKAPSLGEREGRCSAVMRVDMTAFPSRARVPVLTPH